MTGLYLKSQSILCGVAVRDGQGKLVECKELYPHYHDPELPVSFSRGPEDVAESFRIENFDIVQGLKAYVKKLFG